MILFVIRRLVSIAVTFFVVSIIIFLMMHAIPGGPFDGNDMPLSDAVRAKLMARLGLDQPLWTQYLNYMWGVLHFDFGGRQEGALPLVARVAGRDRVEQGAGIGMLRVLEDLRRRRLLDHATAIHHHHAVGQGAYRAQVMADEQHG